MDVVLRFLRQSTALERKTAMVFSLDFEQVCIGQTRMLIAYLKGGLVYGVVDELTPLVIPHLEEETSIVLADMQSLEYVDSSGIGLLVSLMSEMAKRKIRLILVDMSDKIDSLTQQIHLRDIFIVFDTKEELFEVIREKQGN